MKIDEILFFLSDLTYPLNDDERLDGSDVVFRGISFCFFLGLLSVFWNSLARLSDGGIFALVGMGAILSAVISVWCIKSIYCAELSSKPFLTMTLLVAMLTVTYGVIWCYQVQPPHNTAIQSALSYQ